MSEARRRYRCLHCLDRGWIIAPGFSPAWAARAEMIPCPLCRPPLPSRRARWAISLGFMVILVVLILLV